jgi:hypothetical protein
MNEKERDWFISYTNRLKNTVFSKEVVRKAFVSFQDLFIEKVYEGGFHNLNTPFDIYNMNFDNENKMINLPDATIGFKIDEDALILTKRFKEEELSYEVVILEKVNEYTVYDKTAQAGILKKESLPYGELPKLLQQVIVYLVLITKRAAKQALSSENNERIPGIDWDNV